MYAYKLLANAIVEQAVKDYRKVLYELSMNKNNRSARAYKAHIEKFFHSDWYHTLTDVDGDIIISKLKEEYII